MLSTYIQALREEGSPTAAAAADESWNSDMTFVDTDCSMSELWDSPSLWIDGKREWKADFSRPSIQRVPTLFYTLFLARYFSPAI